MTQLLPLLLLGLVVTGCGGTPAAAPAPAPAQSSAVSGPQPLPGMAVAEPVSVRVPRIGVDSTLVPLHLDTAGVLQDPDVYDQAGWFADGPAPGDPGPAVIAGHVDSTDGPAVFYRLRELVAGDEITVVRSDGRTVVFRVDGVQDYPKDVFPTAAVYGPAPGSTLRLITCGGEFDHGKRSYRDNIVAYATAITT
ncbi:class F sortase [Lentzea pudingi]|uniref:Class F sortase n=1 Tax=Lentzea pudingi TaxID=1789439 RepID=A0ABQ2IW75_9PSEU|nr:class F sortase [Lentzea pudingi]GGN29066.1 class F sortase [Lentzea pudingi]